MKERVGVRQISGESKRRWFSSEDFDLIVWGTDREKLIGFELCYDKRGKVRSIRWDISAGFHHMAVDDGEQIFGKYKESPILMADGFFDAKQVHSDLSEVSHLLPNEIAEYVLNRISEYPKGLAEFATAGIDEQ